MTNRNPQNITRRQFLGQSSCAAVGTASLFSTMLNMRMTNTAAAQSLEGDDYKAMVCIFLEGGNDSYNMLVPRGNAEYNEYASTRDDLALPQNSLLPINPLNSDGRQFGVHGSMPEVKSLFEDGNLAFVANVGTLVEPTSLAQYNSGSVTLPLGLYSHSDQIMHWQTSVPDQRTGLGWGGRTADLLMGMNDASNVSMNISLSGNNVFQAGNSVTEYSISPNGVPRILGWNDPGFNTWSINQTAIESMIDAEYANLFHQTYGATMRNAIDGSVEFGDALDATAPLVTQFSDTNISQSLKMVAKSIAARETLGMRRQTYFIMYSGWDHHDEVLNNQALMLSILSRAMGEFYDALVELGVEDDVVTFTASDFARTLTSNGEGSDHAWGGNHMVMGGSVDGQKIYGDYPVLLEGTNLDTGRGVYIPTTSCDEYFSEIAMWFGVDQSNLDMVFPNLDRFYNVGSGAAPVGFLPFSGSVPTSVEVKEVETVSEVTGESLPLPSSKLSLGVGALTALTAGAIALRTRKVPD